MTVSISLPDELEQTLRRRASAAGQDINTFVTSIVTERLGEDPAIPERAESHADYMARVRGIIKKHGIRNGQFDDSRESIYEGRGE